MRRQVSVVIPVYDGVHDVDRCLQSVRRFTASTDALEVDVLVIDDASPDPAISELVERFGRDRSPDLVVTVIVNDQNLGFVRTANLGMARATGDVVLLNADTVVTQGWLDVMADVAVQPGVATVTPLTNHGSICTLPEEVIDAFDLRSANPRIDECAAFVRTHSLERRPPVISGVGYCMWVTRAALDAVGGFDEEAFGRGYGEEVDFCMRATRAGFVHLVDDATFVYHRGGVSFGEASTPSQAAASKVIHDRYRFFARANRSERNDDPLAVGFAALRLALTERDRSRPHVLHLMHTSPDSMGGTEQHVRGLVSALGDEFDFSVMYPNDSGFVVKTAWRVPAGRVTHELAYPGAGHKVSGVVDAGAGFALQAVLDSLEVDVVHIQNLVNFSWAPLEVLESFSGGVVASVHDMFWVCPNHSVLYRGAVACGLPDDLAACTRCLPETKQLPVERLVKSRATVARHLGVVDRWIVPSWSALDHLSKVYELPVERVEVIGHGTLVDVARLRRPPDPVTVYEEPLRLGFVGLGWAKKGLRTINELCERLLGTTIEVHHFGPLVDSGSHPGLHRHGPFDSAILPDLLQAAGINVVLLPGHVPETFSYVMSEALAAGVPVIGARHGALGERIRAEGVGWTFDPESFEELVELVTSLDRCRDELWNTTTAVCEADLAEAEEVAHRYGDIYLSSMERPTT